MWGPRPDSCVYKWLMEVASVCDVLWCTDYVPHTSHCQALLDFPCIEFINTAKQEICAALKSCGLRSLQQYRCNQTCANYTLVMGEERIHATTCLSESLPERSLNGSPLQFCWSFQESHPWLYWDSEKLVIQGHPPTSPNVDNRYPRWHYQDNCQHQVPL